MKIWKIILATLVIFGTGVITGGLLVGVADGMRGYRPHGPARNAHLPQATTPAPAVSNTPHERDPRMTLPLGVPPRRQFPKDFLERLDRELKLTPDQRKQIDQVIDEGQKHTKEIWERIAPEVRQEMKNSREQILNLLSPEQKTRFEELMKPRGNKPAREAQPTNSPAQPAPAR